MVRTTPCPCLRPDPAHADTFTGPIVARLIAAQGGHARRREGADDQPRTNSTERQREAEFGCMRVEYTWSRVHAAPFAHSASHTVLLIRRRPSLGNLPCVALPHHTRSRMRAMTPCREPRRRATRNSRRCCGFVPYLTLLRAPGLAGVRRPLCEACGHRRGAGWGCRWCHRCDTHGRAVRLLKILATRRDPLTPLCMGRACRCVLRNV